MQGMQHPEQTGKTNPNEGNKDMKGNSVELPARSAPLYASPWLAFFYLLFKSQSQDN